MKFDQSLIETFQQVFKPDSFAVRSPQPLSSISLGSTISSQPDGLLEFLNGCHNSYNEGLIRFLIPSIKPGVDVWVRSEGWGEGWDNWSKDYFVFAYDWNGRLIALNSNKLDGVRGEPVVSLLDTSTGESLDSRSNFKTFILENLTQNYNEMLGAEAYREFVKATGNILEVDQCVGFKQPLFLGGSDNAENMEITNIEVYLGLMSQLQ